MCYIYSLQNVVVKKVLKEAKIGDESKAIPSVFWKVAYPETME